MEDWVKISGVVAVLLVIFALCRRSEGFMTPTVNVTTATPSPSIGTHISDAQGLPLTDAMTGLPVANGCNPPQSIDTDLLPKPFAGGDNDFGEFAPNPSALANQSFLTPAKFIGMDTTSGKKRNMSYDIRPDPAIPQCPGAWGSVYNSTIEADPYKKNLWCTQSDPTGLTRQ